MSAPYPLTPADCDLQDFAFMPVDIVQLFGSEFHARVSDAGWRAGVTLWLRAWHQVPAGSLPDDDVLLCRLAELARDLRTWRKIRDEALWGWERASDGRLYHATVADKVNEAWDRKLRQRHRTFIAAIRKHNERHKPEELAAPSFDEWLDLGRPDKVASLVCRIAAPADVARSESVTSHETEANVTATRENVARDIDSKGQGQGQGHYKEGADAPSPRAWPCPPGVNPAHWRDFLKNRRTRRLTNSETAYQGQLRDLERLSSDEWPPGRLVQHAAERGWGGIYDPNERKNGNGRTNGMAGHQSDGLSSTARAAVAVFGRD